MIHRQYWRSDADVRIRVSDLPPTGGGGPTLLRPGAHGVRPLRWRTAKGLLGGGCRLQGQRLLQDGQPQCRQVIEAVDDRDGARRGLVDRIECFARGDDRFDVDVDVDHLVTVDVGLVARDRDVVDRDGLTGRRARKPFDVTSHERDVEEHPLQCRRHRDLTNRFG